MPERRLQRCRDAYTETPLARMRRAFKAATKATSVLDDKSWRRPSDNAAEQLRWKALDTPEDISGT